MSLFKKGSSADVARSPVDIDRDGRKLFADDIIAYIKSEAERRRGEQKTLEWQWCLNGNFYNGNQFCEINPHRGGVEQVHADSDVKERQVFNRIAPIVETRMANLNTLRYGMTVRPNTDELDDDQKARISTKILRQIMQDSGFAKKRQTLTAWAELCGTAFVLSTWDPKAGNVVGSININGVDAKVHEGDIRYELLTAYEVLPESLYAQNVDDQHSIIVEKVIKVDEARALYKLPDLEGDTVDAYTIVPVESGQVYGDFVTSYAMQADKMTDAVKVWMYFEAPSDRYTRGRMAIVCKDKLVYYGEMPYDGIPIVAVKCKEMPGQFFGRSVIQDMIPLQRSYNGVKNKIHDYIKTVAANPMLVPEGSIDDIDDIAENGTAPGNVIEYNAANGKPEPYEYASLPGEVQSEAQSLIQEMEYVAGVSSLMVYGKAPSGVTSGTAIDSLRQIDNTRLSITGDNIREAVKALGKQWLHLYKRYATGYRVSRIAGSNDAGAAFVWSSDDITSYDVTFDTENELKHSPEAQKQAFVEALNMGAFGSVQEMTAETRRKIREAMRVGDGFAEALTLDDVQVKHAQNENIFFARGAIPEIDELDDDDIHIAEHTRYVLQREFERLERENAEYAQHMRSHIAKHKKNKLLKAARERQEMALLAGQMPQQGG